MSYKYKIQHTDTIPERKRGNRQSIYPFAELKKAGDFFAVEKEKKHIQSLASHWGKQNKISLVCRTMDDGKIAVYRAN